MRALWLSLLLGCAVPVERPATQGSFPHAAGYRDQHGADALASGATCETCHGVRDGDLVQGAPPAAPACQSCHAAFPHVAGYGTTAAHGADWRVNAGACTACHGDDGTRAPADLRRGQCTACHTSYPHPDGWAAAGGHGAGVLARGGDHACTACHAADSADPAPCTACHADYPHPDGWAAADAHGAAVTAGATCSAGCHPADPATAAPRLACAGCHDLYPHAAGWPAGHIAVVQARGEGACTACHAEGTPAGGAMPVSCGAACHQGAE